MSNEVGQTVAIWEALAEARTLIEDATRLGEELKVRQEQLGDLLAPSEAALKARTEYLDQTMNDYLSRAEQRMVRAAEEIRALKGCGGNLYSWALDEAQRRLPVPPPLWHRLAVQALAATLGGFLAGSTAIWWTSRPATKASAATVSLPQPRAAPVKGIKPRASAPVR